MTKARQLADLIDPRNEKEPHWRDLESASDELRRLSDENHMIRLQRAEFLSRKQELEEALTVVLELIGGVNE